jgi:phage terminase large subunit
MKIKIPTKFKPLWDKARYKILYGGRGGAKTTIVAQYLLMESLKENMTILCCREFQSSIKNSVHQVLKDEIIRLGLESEFTITDNRIISSIGSQFIFAGIANNIDSIKSIPNIKKCWLEEGQSATARSLEVLIPTIRAPESEIIITFNPYLETDPVYDFVLNPPPNSIIIKVNYFDNPHCPQVLIDEAEYCKSIDLDKYNNIWLGNTLQISDAVIFKNKYEEKEFETPDNVQLYLGVDWGFSNDPAAVTRSFIKDKCLYIDYGYAETGIELDEYHKLLDNVPNSKRLKIYADAAQPGNISLLRRQGYFIEAAKKWPGSIEDGISFLKSFEKIYIHPRCKSVIYEFENYKWKVNKMTDEILPIPEDKNNHNIDSLRYSLFKEILAIGSNLEQWSKLGKL